MYGAVSISLVIFLNTNFIAMSYKNKQWWILFIYDKFFIWYHKFLRGLSTNQKQHAKENGDFVLPKQFVLDLFQKSLQTKTT